MFNNVFTGAQVFQQVTRHESYLNAKRVGVYLSMPTGEIQTQDIVRHALENGKQVFVPYIHKSSALQDGSPRSVMDMVDLRSLQDFEKLQPDKWSIPTIAPETVPERERILGDQKGPVMLKSTGLDVILLPGVAFAPDETTAYCRRLGHGKGYYDFFLHRYGELYSHDRAHGQPFVKIPLLGLALNEQVLNADEDPEVPMNSQDSLVHDVISGDGAIERD